MNVYNESLDPAMGRSKQNSPGREERILSQGAQQLFSPARWWLLVTLHWAENRRRYLLALLAIAGALFAWYSFLIVMDKDAPMHMKYQFSAYYIGLFSIGCLYGSMLFSELGHKTRGIQYLSIPASLFEKLLCTLFFGVLLFFIAYTLLFYLVDIPMVGLANRVMSWNALHMHHNQRPVGYPAVVCNVLANEGAPIPDLTFNLFLVAYFAIQAAFILGSVYFPRYSFIKTVVSLLVFWVVGMLFIIKGIEENLPPGWRLGPVLIEWDHRMLDQTTSEQKLVRSPSWVGDSLFFLVKYCIPLIFWSITYTRLKEKEV